MGNMLIAKQLYFTKFQTPSYFGGLEYGPAETAGYQLVAKDPMPNPTQKNQAETREKAIVKH